MHPQLTVREFMLFKSDVIEVTITCFPSLLLTSSHNKAIYVSLLSIPPRNMSSMDTFIMFAKDQEEIDALMSMKGVLFSSIDHLLLKFI